VFALALVAAVLAAPATRAADKEAINKAVEKGVDYLKRIQPPAAVPQSQIGVTALTALTLLECGVPGDDDFIQKAAAAVRSSCLETDQTYSLALSLLFLDRLGETVDVALIESLGVRLLAGENCWGGWGYTCPKVAEDETRRLRSLVKERNDSGRGEKAPRPADGNRRTVEDLPKGIQAQLEEVRKQRRKAASSMEEMAKAGSNPDDNSNTQFAVLALWVARRYGLPVDDALGETEKRFRRSQDPGGGWGYQSGGTMSIGRPPPSAVMAGVGPWYIQPTPAMTCAGLLGMGLAYGAWNEASLRTDAKSPNTKPGAPPIKAQDPSKDKTIVAAFRILGAWIDVMDHGNSPIPQINVRSGKIYYFLWSLERVGVAYGVEKIGKADWYEWAVGVLLANQSTDGAWNNGEFRNGPDTCFALLVLKRANLAPDLTRALTAQMPKDGMQAALHRGGVAGADSVKVKKPFFDNPNGEDAPGKPNGDTEVARLGKQLPGASGEKQEQLLKELREGKGIAYTNALASAIPNLEGDTLKKAREALAERMARMKSETLGLKLEDDDPEVRRAAALAVAMKEDKPHVYQLIEMLNDREATVARAAHAALKSLSNEDYGPAKDATPEQRAKAVLAWKDWWARQAKDKK
jgi:hypothetical protein